MKRLLAVGVVVLVAIVLVGIIVPMRGSASVTVSATPSVAASPVITKGRWRLAPRTELDRTVLFVSHILIRHRDAEPTVAPFNVGHWQRLPPPPARTREEGSALARHIALRARAAPAAFPDLAKACSEDEVSAGAGGSLGGIRAAIFSAWPQVLDALATLDDGAVSAVVETQFGFHVFRRNPVPAKELVAGRRLVIGYQGATWLDVVRRPDRQPTRRAHAEALAKAQQLAAVGRSAPHQFANLIQEYSEHMDVAQAGDIGVWSTLEAGDLEREREVLARLKVGEISAPIDTAVGITLLQRTGQLERPRYAMTAIQLWFDAEAPATHEASRLVVREKAGELATLVSARPELFQELQRQLCCAEVVQWTAGRGPAGIAEALPRLAIGAIDATPIAAFSSFSIVKRLDPAEVAAPPQPRFALPNPSELDVEYFVRNGTSQHFRALIQAAGAEYERTLAADGPRAAVARLQGELATTLETVTDGDERLAAYRQGMLRLGEAAGSDEQRRYEQLVSRRLEGLLLGGGG